jgi:hypothetical protein
MTQGEARSVPVVGHPVDAADADTVFRDVHLRRARERALRPAVLRRARLVVRWR